MNTEKKPNPGALDAVSSGINKANKRSTAKFDGVLGSLPGETSLVLSHIVEYLREYLFDDKRFSKRKVRKLLEEALPTVHAPRRVEKKTARGRQYESVENSGFRSVSTALEDDGVRIAIGILNSIGSSVLRIGDGQIKLDGQLLNSIEVTMYLLSGRAGLARHRYMERQRTAANKGSQTRSETREHHERRWVEIGTPLRQKNPELSNMALAKHIARRAEEPVSTIRQALPRLGLSKKT
jgi:hypothetical protein